MVKAEQDTKWIEVTPKTVAALVRARVPLIEVRGSSELPLGQGRAQISMADVVNIVRNGLMPEGGEIRGPKV